MQETIASTTMQNAYHSLIKDTISFLKEQKNRSFFAQKEELSLLQEREPKKEEKTTIPSQKEASSFSLNLSSLQKEQKPKEIKKSFPSKDHKEPYSSHTGKGSSPTPMKTPFVQKLSDTAASFDELQKILSSASPHYALHKEVPNDEKAKQIATNWLYKKKGATITLIAGKEDLAKIAFLKNLTQALDVRFAPTKMIFASEIEKENSWELFLKNPEIHLILAVDASIRQFPNLMRFYRENPARKEFFLHEIPLFLLPDPGLYLKKSSLKPLLWKTLTEKIPELFKEQSS